MRALFLLALPLSLSLAISPARADQKRYMLTGFDSIQVDGPVEVNIISGGSTGATGEGDRAALDALDVRVTGGMLVVRVAATRQSGNSGAPAVIKVSTQRLRAAHVNGGAKLHIDRLAGQTVDVGLNGSGSIAVDTVDADALAVTLTGTGQVTLAGKAIRARYLSVGAGAIDAGGLEAHDILVNQQSSSDGRYRARYTAQVTALGLGRVDIEGRPKCTISGGGPVNCATSGD